MDLNTAAVFQVHRFMFFLQFGVQGQCISTLVKVQHLVFADVIFYVAMMAVPFLVMYPKLFAFKGFRFGC
jgi:hypothetical protein